MLRPVEMCKVNILVLRKHVAAVTQLLGEREVLHLVDATAQSPGRLLTSFGTADAHRLRQLSDKCAALIRQLDITGGAEPAADMTVNEMAERLDAVSRTFEEKSQTLAELITEVNRAKQQAEEKSGDEKPSDDASTENTEDNVPTELRERLTACRESLKNLGETHGKELRAIRAQLAGLVMLEDVRGQFGRLGNRLACISGWIDKCDETTVKDIVADATGNTGVVQVMAADADIRVRTGKEKVPTKLKGNAWTRPFQMLVANFGIPAYNEIDPTIFFGISFVLLFGYMFGDIGQGLVLVLAGLWAKFTRRKLDGAVRDGGMLLVMCGLCAMVFGVAYGSVFGYEHLFESLWVNPMKSSDTTELLLTAVGIGTVLTSIAVIFNIINHIRARKLYDGTIERFGAVGLLFFWVCLCLGVWLMSGHEFATWMVIPLALPLVLLFIREPLHNVLHHHGPFAGGFIGVFLECCIGVMETLTGYFSSTVSFVRVGAFAISHAALCFAVFTLAGMMEDIPCGGVLKVIVIIFGNVLVICFEGMVAMIQCVRLEYYELFGKYFGGDGIPYRPFSLKGQKTED